MDPTQVGHDVAGPLGAHPAVRTTPVLSAAVPIGYRPAMHPMLWVAAVSEAAEFDYRSDAVTYRTDLAWALVDSADWSTRTVACGWTQLAHTAHISRRTLARSLAWLRRQYLLGLVSSGVRTTGRVNDLAVYVLLEPVPPL